MATQFNVGETVEVIGADDGLVRSYHLVVVMNHKVDLGFVKVHYDGLLNDNGSNLEEVIPSPLLRPLPPYECPTSLIYVSMSTSVIAMGGGTESSARRGVRMNIGGLNSPALGTLIWNARLKSFDPISIGMDRTGFSTTSKLCSVNTRGSVGLKIRLRTGPLPFIFIVCT